MLSGNCTRFNCIWENAVPRGKILCPGKIAEVKIDEMQKSIEYGRYERDTLRGASIDR